MSGCSDLQYNYLMYSINVSYLGIVTIPLESLGDSITTAVLVTWQKETGDAVKEDDVIAVVEVWFISISKYDKYLIIF